MIAERYPEEARVHAYTDGSATGALTNGGAGVYVKLPEEEVQSASIRTGKYRSNYMAKIQDLVQAASMIRVSGYKCQQVVFLSDALSVLEATAGDKLPRLAGSFHDVTDE